jgi:hypothetical protein
MYEGTRDVYRVLVGDLIERNHLEDLNINERIILQDRQCMYYVTLRRIHATTVAVEN